MRLIENTLKISTKTKAGVFIIESLDFEDEHEAKEGEILYGILKMSKIPVEYVYIRSYTELEHFLNEFLRSEFRFLHISCHGNEEGIATTLEDISNDELASLLNGKLKARRLFMSACATVNKKLAEQLFPATACNSLVGPNEDVNMNEIAIFWASFYHLMFKTNRNAMKKKDLIEKLDILAKLYSIPVKYFKKSTKAPYFTEQKLEQGAPKPRIKDYDDPPISLNTH